jgi:xanthine dehydrogenase accessory factor
MVSRVNDLLSLAADLQRRGERFALATVVRCEAPTSAKPGAKALVRADGTVSGWVGGACAEPVVVREALAAIEDGRPRLVGLIGDSARGPGRAAGPGRTAGMIEYPMTCHSGGTLEIYVEPYLPKPLLILVGHGPVIEALARFGAAAEYIVQTLGAEDAATLLGRAGVARHASVVVATHADSDEDTLQRILATDAGYVSLVASRRRATAIVDRLREAGVSVERLARLKAPAGLDIGAESPNEIAVSILAEIIQHRRTAKPSVAPEAPAHDADTKTAIDPICGMTVDVATAEHRSETAARIVYFCCRHCKTTFDRQQASA